MFSYLGGVFGHIINWCCYDPSHNPVGKSCTKTHVFLIYRCRTIFRVATWVNDASVFAQHRFHWVSWRSILPGCHSCLNTGCQSHHWEPAMQVPGNKAATSLRKVHIIWCAMSCRNDVFSIVSCCLRLRHLHPSPLAPYDHPSPLAPFRLYLESLWDTERKSILSSD